MDATRNDTRERFPWTMLIMIVMVNIAVFIAVTIIWQGIAFYLLDRNFFKGKINYIQIMGASFYYWLPIQLLINLTRAIFIVDRRPAIAKAHFLSLLVLALVSIPLLFTIYFGLLFLIITWIQP
jgi:hypothetical protein